MPVPVRVRAGVRVVLMWPGGGRGCGRECWVWANSGAQQVRPPGVWVRARGHAAQACLKPPRNPPPLHLSISSPSPSQVINGRDFKGAVAMLKAAYWPLTLRFR